MKRLLLQITWALISLILIFGIIGIIGFWIVGMMSPTGGVDPFAMLMPASLMALFVPKATKRFKAARKLPK